MNKPKGEPVAVANVIMPYTENQEQLSKLFREHYRRVLNAAYRITGNMADAEDVAQAVFLRYSGIESTPVESSASYFYRAAINGALDLLRRRKVAATSPIEEAANVAAVGRGSSPETEASSRELGDWLRLAIAELSPRAAEMFTLRYIEEMGNRDIAAIMNTSQAVVAVTLHNARSRLKKRLIELNGERR
jgi:RNA polymerase sigma factor (sigma-70 family)